MTKPQRAERTVTTRRSDEPKTLPQVSQERPEDALELQERTRLLGNALKRLTTREREVIERTQGLGGRESEPTEALARALNVSTSRVRKLKQQALDKLRAALQTSPAFADERAAWEREHPAPKVTPAEFDEEHRGKPSENKLRLNALIERHGRRSVEKAVGEIPSSSAAVLRHWADLKTGTVKNNKATAKLANLNPTSVMGTIQRALSYVENRLDFGVHSVPPSTRDSQVMATWYGADNVRTAAEKLTPTESAILGAHYGWGPYANDPNKAATELHLSPGDRLDHYWNALFKLQAHLRRGTLKRILGYHGRDAVQYKTQRLPWSERQAIEKIHFAKKPLKILTPSETRSYADGAAKVMKPFLQVPRPFYPPFKPVKRPS